MTGLRAGPWELLERLGGGGQATVYRARHAGDGRRAAVKVVGRGPWGDPEVRARFRRERESLAAVEHPNVVPVLDAGEDGGRGYVAMGLARGGTLADRLRRGPLSDAEAAALIRALAEGLDAVHASGRVHRDVTPANVLLDPAGPWLGDLGLARAAGSTAVTAPGTLVGTAGYLAPEVIGGDRAGPASDRYALAALAYRVLAGRPPFARDDPAALLHAHARLTPPPASAARPDLPPAVDRALARGLARRPGDRPASARELAADIAAALGGREPEAPTRRLRVRRRAPRARRLLAAGAGALALAGAGAAGVAAVVLDREPSTAPPPPAPAAVVPGPAGRDVPAGPAAPGDLGGAPVPAGSAAADVGDVRVVAAPGGAAAAAGLRASLRSAGYRTAPIEAPGLAGAAVARMPTFADVLGRDERWALAVAPGPAGDRLVAVRGAGDAPAAYVRGVAGS